MSDSGAPYFQDDSTERSGRSVRASFCFSRERVASGIEIVKGDGFDAMAACATYRRLGDLQAVWEDMEDDSSSGPRNGIST